MTTATICDDFRQAIADAGLTPPDVILADGRFHRFSSNGEADDDAGWYKVHSDGIPAGAFGCHRLDLKQKWCAKSDQQMTPAECTEYRKYIAAIYRQRDAEERRRHAASAKHAQTLWEQVAPATADHPYLLAKQVQPHGLRIDDFNQLVIPMMSNHTITSLQFISANGDKLFLSGGTIKGSSYMLGNPTDVALILVAEGFSTAASLHEATGYPVVIAFYAANLTAVAQQLRQQYPTATILLCGDHDPHEDGKPNTGFECARTAATAIEGRLAMADLGGKKCDFNDVAREQGLEAVREAIEAAINPSPAQVPEPVAAAPWPVLAHEALYGLAGEVVALLSPHTEADPVALLTTFLSEYGCAIGRPAHLILDGSRHPLLIWAVLVGKSSKSRKGSSERRVNSLIQRADPHWTRGLFRGTLSTGEGLVQAVHDPIMKDEPDRKTGELRQICTDQGVTDKRLFLVQSEFGSMLRIMHRDGNSLSGVLRDAWDGLDLCPMTKTTTIRATAPHVSIVGHTPADEFQRNLTELDMSNGLANRLMFFVVQRAQELPDYSEPAVTEIEPVIARLKAALQSGRTADRLTMTSAAREDWRAIYHDLSGDRSGIIGPLLGRAEAHVQRLAAVYCLLDQQRQIDTPHLAAALAVWDYVEASTEYLFGHSTGDPDADAILAALRRSGELTDTDISALFNYHRTQARLDHAKQLLQTAGLIIPILHKTKGRPIRIWQLKPIKAQGPS